ncbi:type II toxin-antitoxin system Phd/YefM family antitoxin [Budviciaceae bacterium BWR-B9]|uniref:Antitoxin n=1 Tax=Limnobaculum allomyrinae TaxID=2791986 RepID=A0ABS1IV86_9GAMM|nr:MULTISPECIES: type II toxin-antitoxin system Phd/YefM family antitoxin [Limnobaculum]MBK5145658.1 type II toxin-antitoxin system Phd/YefM family antitoxin [Limnobaculum allomyrinae]MBV7692603.1 type II toxin-antitoxin system Phd/YefM family antitoxin [Limnobaculum sp. M2-1]
MHSYTLAQAKTNFSTILDIAINGNSVEITRRGKATVVIISKAEFEAYQNVKQNTETDLTK